MLDFDVGDNAGGVSLRIERLETRPTGLLPQFEAAIAVANAKSIRELQERLEDRGFSAGTPDGRYGTATRRALANCISAGQCTADDLPAVR